MSKPTLTNFILSIALALTTTPIGAESLGSNSSYIERQRLFQQKVNRLMRNYQTIVEHIHQQLVTGQMRDAERNAALRKSLDRYIDSRVRPWSNINYGSALAPGVRSYSTIRHRYLQLQQNRLWMQKLLNKPSGFRARIPRPRFHRNW